MAPAPDSGKPIVTRKTLTSAVIDAQQSPGMLAAVTAADLAVRKVLGCDTDDSTGAITTTTAASIAIVCTHNSSMSSGQLAYCVERMARQGVIGVAMCNSPEFVAAAAGAKPVFGTNPLAVGIPIAGSDTPFTVPSVLGIVMAARVFFREQAFFVAKSFEFDGVLTMFLSKRSYDFF